MLFRLAFLVPLLLCAVLSPPSAAAQERAPSRIRDLAGHYRSARFMTLARELLQREGLEVEPMRPEHVPSASDTIHARIVASMPRVEPPPPPPVHQGFQLTGVRSVQKLEAPWFQNTFQDTRWAYLGNGGRGRIDTTYTRELRAYLEKAFGAPTRTLAEVDFSGIVRREDYIQFEYWLVVNDSIPVVISDMNGPLGRGVLLSSDYRYRERLPELRAALLDDLVDRKELAPYVDYFYNADEMSWHLAGYDGRRFFLERIAAPQLMRGRPWRDFDQD